MLIPNETIRSAARVVWQHDDGFGVEFRDEKTLSILSEIQNRTNETRDRLNEYLFQFGDATTKIDEDIRECIGSLNVHMRLKRLREEFEENRESVALVFENSPEQAAPRIELETDAEEEVVADYNSSIDDLAQSIEAIILQFADEFGADSREITFLRKTHSEIQIRGKRRTKVSQRRGFGKRKPLYKQDVA